MNITILNKEGIVYGTMVIMETIICYKCAVPFAIPQKLDQFLRNSKDSFYCPNGHSQAYLKSKETILLEKMEKQKQDFQMRLDGLNNNLKWAREQRDNVIKERTVLKGKLTKVKNRIKNGVCPCCNRTFTNLANHMKNQHPEFDAMKNKCW